MDLELADKRAVVTGGGTGIGKAIARELAQEQVRVIITGRREDVLKSSADELSAETGFTVTPFVADMGDADSVAALKSYVVSELGGIDILVNNAAEQPAQLGPSFTDISEEWFDRQLNVKVLGYIRTAQAFSPLMIEQGWGRIINVSGTGARQTVSVIGSIRNVSVAALTKNLADELGPHGINVSVIHPGPTATEGMLRRLEEASPSDVERYFGEGNHFNAIGRVVTPQEIGWVAAFLASPKSVSVTGDAILTAGGIKGFIYY